MTKRAEFLVFLVSFSRAGVGDGEEGVVLEIAPHLEKLCGGNSLAHYQDHMVPLTVWNKLMTIEQNEKNKNNNSCLSK